MRPTSDDDVAQLLLYDQQDRRTWRNNFRDVGRRPSRILNAVFVLGIFAFLALLFHIYSVSLLRDVKVTLLDLIVPDMCHADTNAQMKVQLMNPSYCSPMIRSISYTIIAQGLGTVIGSIQIPSFKLSSDKSIKLLDLQIHIHLSPFELFETIKKYKHNLRILESYTVEIGCFLIPLKKTIQLSRDIAAENALFFLHPNESWNGTMEQLLLRILKTISLSHFRVEDDMIHERVFAFTTVKFGYQSRIKWNVPSFALWLENAQYGSILQVGMKRFILGTVNTHISAFTVLQHNETKSLLQMLKSYLASNQDMTMSVRGSERHNDCYFSQLLQYIQIDFIIPSQVDGKPVFLRKYAVQPYLKQLNSKTRVCLLQLNVSIIVNNPLPITFQLLRTEFDLYYKVYKGKTERFLNEKSSLPISSKETFHPFPNRHESPYTVFLAHIDETYSITWAAHEEHQVLLQVNIQKFIICTKLFQLYLQNQLFFTVWKGVLGLRIAGGNLSIPFQFNDIHVTPHFK
ncbi:unnamed protein product [Albugo candida]|uniref:Uncharacterized protein n=1 Tax=Albugo candida TaxID=65357 RepID=A0A024G0A5_9STRA|nr:unnamed protein product [Albugo candida]|eukprot:CCI39745.1 unnamed protein product [Albugo candida]